MVRVDIHTVHTSALSISPQCSDRRRGDSNKKLGVVNEWPQDDARVYRLFFCRNGDILVHVTSYFK